jgi:hypothetical protein
MTFFQTRVVMHVALALSCCLACGSRSPIRRDEITALRIERFDPATRANVVLGEWRLDRRPARAADLASALEDCRQDWVKFVSRYRVVAARRGGDEVTFLVNHKSLKAPSGATFSCRGDVEGLVERLVGSGPE